jgi:CheY-like chemotaxis protein
MRKLIVENSAIIAKHLASLVSHLGHEVCATSATASDAIARAAVLKLMAYDPIDFLGKPVSALLLQRALRRAEGLSGL